MNPFCSTLWERSNWTLPPIISWT